MAEAQYESERGRYVACAGSVPKYPGFEVCDPPGKGTDVDGRPQLMRNIRAAAAHNIANCRELRPIQLRSDSGWLTCK